MVFLVELGRGCTCPAGVPCPARRGTCRSRRRTRPSPVRGPRGRERVFRPVLWAVLVSVGVLVASPGVLEAWPKTRGCSSGSWTDAAGAPALTRPRVFPGGWSSRPWLVSCAARRFSVVWRSLSAVLAELRGSRSALPGEAAVRTPGSSVEAFWNIAAGRIVVLLVGPSERRLGSAP